MSPKSRYAPLFFTALFFALGTAAGTAAFAQDSQARLAFYFGKFQSGMNRYQESRWLDAAAEFRVAQEEAAGSVREWSEALYWVILSEIAAADYASALLDIDDFEKNAPDSGRVADLVYHRARAYYYLGNFEDALLLFRQYADTSGPGGESRKSAALYWMGECLYSLGHLDRAAGFFNQIVEQYPASPKYEASVYRLDLIKHQKIEAELLALLKWSHEESLRSSEEYQRKERTYGQAMNAYQRRIAELLKDTPASGSEEEQLRERARQLRGEIQADLENGRAP